MSNDTSTEPAAVLVRYANLFGAVVTVRDPDPQGPLMLVWSCGGCLDRGQATNLRTARDQANGHASVCRALPQTPDTAS